MARVLVERAGGKTTVHLPGLTEIRRHRAFLAREDEGGVGGDGHAVGEGFVLEIRAALAQGSLTVHGLALGVSTGPSWPEPAGEGDRRIDLFEHQSKVKL